MRKITFVKKIIGFSLVGIPIFFSFSFAADDCGSTAVTSWADFSGFFSLQDLEIARSHLKTYCCSQQKKQDDSCTNLVYGGPDSPYWYDHLIDVGLRKLDAESLYPGMEPDPQGKEWRDFIQDSSQLKTPQAIQDAYVKFFALSSPYFDPRDKDITTYQNNLQDILSRVDGLNLHEKYINYCFVAMMMYYKGLNLNNIDIVADGYYGKCLSMVQSRIEVETNLAMMISQYNGATLLVESISSYTKQFVQNRLMKLFDKIVAISSLFNTLAKQAPLSNTCTK